MAWRKSLESLWAPNQSFRDFVCFQWLRPVFVSPFSPSPFPFPAADLPDDGGHAFRSVAGLDMSPGFDALAIIAMISQKRNPLVTVFDLMDPSAIGLIIRVGESVLLTGVRSEL
jgi:hypothetical protein